jgi:hypothetical protein
MFQPVTLALFRGLFHSILAAAGPRIAEGKERCRQASWRQGDMAKKIERL